MLAYPDAQLLDIAGPLEVFARTSRLLRDTRPTAGRDVYEILVLAADSGPVRMSNGLQLVASRAYRQAGRIDTLLVSGGIGYQAAANDRALIGWLRNRYPLVQRIGSICTGAFLLARAGILNSRSVVTHWRYCAELAAVAPDAQVHPNALYVASGKVFTSAGVTAGMDLALSLVEADCGRRIAVEVAQELVMFAKRPGGQSQFSRLLATEALGTGILEDVYVWMLQNIDGDLSVPALAQRAAMSERTFARKFLAEYGTTPGHYVERIRVDAARARLSESTESFKAVARRCGFRDEQNMRRAFKRVLNIAPVDYRERFGVS